MFAMQYCVHQIDMHNDWLILRLAESTWCVVLPLSASKCVRLTRKLVASTLIAIKRSH